MHIPRMTLQEWMSRQKVRDDWLAEQIGKSRSQANRIRRDGTTDANVALKLARVTGLPMETFVKRSEQRAA